MLRECAIDKKVCSFDLNLYLRAKIIKKYGKGRKAFSPIIVDCLTDATKDVELSVKEKAEVGVLVSQKEMEREEKRKQWCAENGTTYRGPYAPTRAKRKRESSAWMPPEGSTTRKRKHKAIDPASEVTELA